MSTSSKTIFALSILATFAFQASAHSHSPAGSATAFADTGNTCAPKFVLQNIAAASNIEFCVLTRVETYGSNSSTNTCQIGTLANGVKFVAAYAQCNGGFAKTTCTAECYKNP
jgi:pyruvate/2-oxoacid:ferredoxin oxidoreductase beta subunit